MAEEVITVKFMRLIKYLAVAFAMLAILATSSFAPPTAQLPDTGSTVGLLGCAFAGLAGLRAWLNK
jgi:SNF family Na+-dependent transporter